LLLLHDRLAGRRFRLRLCRRLLHRLRACDRRGTVNERGRTRRRDRCAAYGSRLRHGHRRRLGSDGVRRWIRGRSRCPRRYRENHAQHRESSHRSPPAPQQRPSSLSCHIPPSPGLFSKLLRFLGCVNEALRPAGRPGAGLRGAAFCHSARDLPAAFAAASCSAADRPIANWLFFADWPTACVPPPPD